jgi:nicotinate-nucleotide adenylyltransferase
LAKIGIYSGAFDPVHTGHLAFAQQSIEELSLDLLYILPEDQPWRKQNVTNLDHRLAMMELAAKDTPKIKLHLPGLAASHDVKSTMRAFDLAHPGDDLVLLMGVDIFLNLDKWDGYQELLDRAEFVVALRTEDDGEELVYKMLELPDARVTKIVTDQATVSSSKIREQIANGETPKSLNPDVFEYIKSRRLYQI